MLNVLILAQYFPPYMGGASIRVSNVVKGLLRKGCNIIVVAAFPHYPHGKIPVGYKNKPLVIEEKESSKVLRVWVPALPHNNVCNRIVLHFSFMISSLYALPFTGKVDVDKYGVSAQKIHVIEVGIDKIEPHNINTDANRQFIVMYGVLGIGYDFEIILEAASLLINYNNIIFIIRGIGEYASNIRRMINKLNLKNVVLDTTFLPKHKLSALLRSADAFILPMATASFVDEGLPTKVFEYQSFAKPIICVSNGEPARYVNITSSGIIVKPKDVDGFAEAVVRVYARVEWMAVCFKKFDS